MGYIYTFSFITYFYLVSFLGQRPFCPLIPSVSLLWLPFCARNYNNPIDCIARNNRHVKMPLYWVVLMKRCFLREVTCICEVDLLLLFALEHLLKHHFVSFNLLPLHFPDC